MHISSLKLSYVARDLTVPCKAGFFNIEGFNQRFSQAYFFIKVSVCLSCLVVFSRDWHIAQFFSFLFFSFLRSVVPFEFIEFTYS